ncbi:hypothetical protein AB5J72_04935 [Streptomyces sp. CG1]|uniref:hypothetical protein n=1 Tax=Streptomyces sp. CG1 TaxID=1287523 RepID=UPI0034E297F6
MNRLDDPPNRLDRPDRIEIRDRPDRRDRIDRLDRRDRMRPMARPVRPALVDRADRADRAGEPIYVRLVAEWRAQGRTVPAEADALWAAFPGPTTGTVATTECA